MDWQTKPAIYLNESGLYSLILRSGKAEAKQFARWITKEVLPSIRKTGKYVMQDPIIETNKYLEILENKAGYDESMIHADHVINISDEKSLHYHVVDYIRRFHPNMIFNDFGGHQVHKSEDTTIDTRIDRWRSGYSKGSCDLIILNYHKQHQSLCIEFKNPRGTGNGHFETVGEFRHDEAEREDDAIHDDVAAKRGDHHDPAPSAIRCYDDRLIVVAARFVVVHFTVLHFF